MSRVGRRPITVPAGVEIVIDVERVTAKGPKGELCRSFAGGMEISLQEGVLTVSRATDNRIHRSLHGLTRSLLANMVEGVSQGFRKDLEFHGVGYRVQKVGEGYAVQVGYSKPVDIVPPDGIVVESDAPNRMSISGIDKELVGQFAAEIRGIRPPDAYLGKGIRYAGEQVRRKAGKAGKIGRKK